MKKFLLTMIVTMLSFVGAWGQEERNLVGNMTTTFNSGMGNLDAFCIPAGNSKVAQMQVGDKLIFYIKSGDGTSNNAYSFCNADADGHIYWKVYTNGWIEDGGNLRVELTLNAETLQYIQEHGLKVNTNDTRNIDFLRITFVSSSVPADILATGVTISGPTSVSIDGTIKLHATITPDNATEKTVTWSSNDAETASIDQNGEITGHKAGTVTITATTTDGSEKSSTYEVTIKEGYTLSATADPSTVNNAIDRTITISPVVKLGDVVQSEGFVLSYSLLDNTDDKVTISGNVVTAIASATAGTKSVLVTVTDPNGVYAGATTTVNFIIEQAPYITMTSINQTSFSVAKGSADHERPSIQVESQVNNGDATYMNPQPEITYTAEVLEGQPAIVTLTQNPGNAKWFRIDPISAGTTKVKITASAVVNGVTTSDSKTVDVTVTGMKIKFTMPDNLTVNYDQPLTLEAIKAAITKVYTEANSTQTDVDPANYEVEVYKDDVKLDDDIEAKDANYSIKVKVKSLNTSEFEDSDQKTITVIVTHLNSFVLSLDNIDKTKIKPGETVIIIPSSKDNGAEIDNVTYTCTSSDPTVATVSEHAVDGKIIVTGVKDGTVTISVTARPEDSNYATMQAVSSSIKVNSKTDGTVTTSESEDGKTLTIICSGDVCNPDQEYNKNGYKFQNLEANWLFADQSGTAVANGAVYNEQSYYTRAIDYVKDPIDYYTKYTLKEDVTVYSYDESNKSYTKLSAGTDITNSTLKTISGSEELASLDGKTVTKYYFKDNTGGTVYKVVDGNYVGANYNDEYDEGATYVITSNAWHPSADNTQTFVFADHSDLFVSRTYFTPDANIFKKEGDNYVDVSGTEKPTADANTYVANISFANADKTSSEISSSNDLVNTNGKVYYKGDTKTIVNNNEPYESGTNYYLGNYTYTAKTKQELIDENKLVVAGEIAFWDALVKDVNAHEYENVVFKTATGESTAMICNHVTQAFMNATTVRVLDYSDVAISSIDSPFSSLAMTNPNQDTSGNNLGTFMCGANGMGYNYSVETLYTPQVTTANFELMQKAFAYFHELRNLHLSDGIVTLGQQSIDANGTFMRLSTITFPNTLKTIKEYAVANHKVMAADTNPNKYGSPSPYAIESLTFPAGLEKIYTNAFQGTCPKDVYFLGVEAPNVDKYAWGDDAYISNNALTPAAASLSGVTVDQSTGYSTRMNYIAQSGWIAMLHYPAACTKDQAAKYTDVTRHYYRIENYKVGNTVDASKVNTDDTHHYNTDNPSVIYDEEFAYYTPGKETVNLTGTGATSLAAEKRFQNRYGNYNTNGVGAYTGGFYDYTVGSQILWPSISMAYRATVVAQNDVLWDGVTTIGQGIRDAGNGSFEGNGTEYIGLHQFVLAAADVMATSTYEYDMLKYADGKWHTICVPFNMTKKQMKETFGASNWHLSDEAEIIAGNYVVCNENKYTGEYEHLRLCEFSAVVRTEDNITIKFNKEMFIEADDDDIVLKAHTPYMIHAKKGELVEGGEATAKFYGYQMESGSPGFTNVTSTGNANNGVYTFKGNYSSFTTDGSNHAVYMPLYSYFFNGTEQAFRFQIGTEGKWTPYAAIVEAPNGADDNAKYFTTSASSRVRTMFFGDLDDEETAIEKIAIEADGELIFTNAPVYNLSGQVVGNSLDNLAPGIYIVNGKKYMIR